jgi:hypothetical protein
MLTAHHVNAFLLIGVCALSGVAALLARRRGAAGQGLAQLLALAQTLLVAQVGLGLLLWFGVATLLAAALGVRAWMTA